MPHFLVSARVKIPNVSETLGYPLFIREYENRDKAMDEAYNCATEIFDDFPGEDIISFSDILMENLYNEELSVSAYEAAREEFLEFNVELVACTSEGVWYSLETQEQIDFDSVSIAIVNSDEDVVFLLDEESDADESYQEEYDF